METRTEINLIPIVSVADANRIEPSEYLLPVPNDLIQPQDVWQAVVYEVGGEILLKSYGTMLLRSVPQKMRFYFRVKAVYEKDDQTLEIFFFVKIRSFFDVSDEVKSIALIRHNKETESLIQVIPLLNDQLEDIGEPPLKAPKYILQRVKEGGLVIYMKDKIASGFATTCEEVGFSDIQTFVVAKELARLHAITKVFMARRDFNVDSLRQTFKCLGNVYLHMTSEQEKEAVKAYSQYTLQEVETFLYDLDHFLPSEYLVRVRTNFDKCEKKIMDLTEPFVAITYGDIYLTNIMFR